MKHRVLNRARSVSVKITLPALWLAVAALLSIFAPALAPADPNAIDLARRLQAPAWITGDLSVLLGTDNLGRDIASRILYAGQTSFLIATAAAAVAAVLGTTVGLAAAHFRGAIDDLVTSLIDFQATIPFFVVALGVIAALGASTLTIAGLLCVYGWERYARLSRALAVGIAPRGYIVAAKVYGAPTTRIYWRHVLPNIAPALLANWAIGFTETILLESTLSFLGIGIQPPAASLGAMMSSGRSYLADAWWMAVLPGVVIFFTAVSMSALVDACRQGK